MHNIIFLFISILLLTTACTKVIEIDLNEADSRIVIEAPLYAGTNNFNVRLTKSGNYFDNTELKTIDDAIITLTEEDGTITTLDFQGQGYYQIAAFEAIAGRNFRLDVLAEEEAITATTYLPEPITIDSLRTEYEPESAFGDAGYVLYTVFQDPELTEDYYRLRYTINDSLDNAPSSLFLFDDAFSNGNVINIPNFTSRFLSTPDSLIVVDVELIVMDAKVHDYFSTLSEIISDQGSAAPANPNSNLEGNALGYFGAFNISRASIEIPE